MALKLEKIDVWSGEIRNEVGGLAAALKPLVDAGADFSFVIARRQPTNPGAGIVFLGGIRGARQAKAATSAGLSKSADVAGLRIETADKPGALQHVLDRLAGAGISLTGVSASVIGSKCSFVAGFSNVADRDLAAKVLRK
ncbi:MAG: hypothetical protein ACT4QC_24115 [Planctomycetaceae bacterium]